MSIETFKVKELYQVKEYSRHFKFELEPPDSWDGNKVDFEIEIVAKSRVRFKIPSEDVRFGKSGTILVDSYIPDNIRPGKGDFNIFATYPHGGLIILDHMLKHEMNPFEWA